MCSPAQAGRCAGIHGNWTDLPMGNSSLFTTAAMGESEGEICPQRGARQYERSHHLDALLRAARVLSSLQIAFHTRALSRLVHLRTTALFDVGAREARGLARATVAPGSACERVACDPAVGGSLSDGNEKEMTSRSRSAAHDGVSTLKL